MNLENIYMLVSSLLLIKVNGQSCINSLPLQFSFRFPALSWSYLKIKRFSNSFLFIDLTFGKGEGDSCVDNSNGSYKLYCPRKSCGLNERCPADVLQANEIAMPAVQGDNTYHD